MKQVDFLIAGQGLAGTTLAVELIRREKSVLILDKVNELGSSRVSAGLINPVIVKRYVRAWRAEETLQAAIEYYREEERILNDEFFHMVPLNKILSNEKEITECQSAYEKNTLEVFADKRRRTNFEDGISAPFGAFHINRAGFLDPRRYLDGRRSWFARHGLMREQNIDYGRINTNSERVIYDDIECAAIIFCEGAKADKNPYLTNLPFRNTKGEILTIESDLKEKELLSKHVFILPLGQGQFRVGSTYSWNPQDELPTEEGRNDLMAKFREIVPERPAIVKDHIAGTRPTMSDRRPVLGYIPSYEGKLAVYNGLGSRGVMLAPLMAAWLADHLCGVEPEIPAEVSMERFRDADSVQLPSRR